MGICKGEVLWGACVELLCVLCCGLQVLENRIFSEGLHILGQPPAPDQAEQYLAAYFGGWGQLCHPCAASSFPARLGLGCEGLFAPVQPPTHRPISPTAGEDLPAEAVEVVARAGPTDSLEEVRARLERIYAQQEAGPSGSNGAAGVSAVKGQAPACQLVLGDSWQRASFCALSLANLRVPLILPCCSRRQHRGG